MNAAIKEPVMRGDFLTYEVEDRSRVSHPKTADIVDLNGSYLVVPAHTLNPVRKCDTLDEAMSFINRYIGFNE